MSNLFEKKLETKAEPKVVDPVDRQVVAAVRAAGRTCRIDLGRRSVETPPVATPFPNVSSHIVYSKFIRTLCSHIMSLDSAKPYDLLSF